MSTENIAKSMQQKLATASDTKQAAQVEALDFMTGELEDSELEAVAGGIQTITVSGPTPDYVTTLMRERDGIATKYAAIFQNANF